MRGRQKRDEVAGTSLHMFRFRFRAEMFSELSAVFLFSHTFVCFVLIWLCIILLFIWFLESVIKQTLRATGTSSMAVRVSARYNSSFISLPLSTKDHKTKI